MSHNPSLLSSSAGVSISRFIYQKEPAKASGELSQILRDIVFGIKMVRAEISKGSLLNLLGSAHTRNVHGEEQQKLDQRANECFQQAMLNEGKIAAIASEENTDLVLLNNPDGKYVMAMDPLDGSGNIDVNGCVGTIFSIYKRLSPLHTPVNEADVLQEGEKQVLAGYVLYGPSTLLVFGTPHTGVNGFTYDEPRGEFFLSHPALRIPPTGTMYSINEGLYHLMTEKAGDALRAFLDHGRKKGWTARYTGALVADFHRNLLKGGVYVYPKTQRDPHGKLRLVYECNPMAMLAELAGGAATDHTGQRILTQKPTQLHQRIAFYVGQKELLKQTLHIPAS